MKIILSGLLPTPGLHCLYSSLYNLYRYMGWPYEEHELFFLCQGMRFRFALSESKKLQNITQNLLDLIRIDYIEQINTLTCCLKQTVSYIDHRANQTTDSICSVIGKALRTRGPILSFLRSTVLTYHILENPNENLGAHGLLLYGIDSDKGIVYLSDSFVTDYSNHIDIFQSTMDLSKFCNYLIGLCVFEPPRKKLIFSERIALFVLHIEKYLYTKSIQDGGFTALLYILQELQYSELDGMAYISLVFLLKAYLMMTLPYFERLMKQVQCYNANRPFRHLHQYTELQDEWNAFFLRCLGISNRLSSRGRMAASGLEIAERYRGYLQDCLEYLYDVMEN